MHRVRRLSVLSVFVIAATLVLPLTASASSGSVSIRDIAHLNPILKFNGSPSYGFRPIVALVGAGGMLVFTNLGLEPHTVSSFSFRVPVPISPDVTLLLPFADGVFDSSPSVPPIMLGGEGLVFPDQINPGTTFTLSTAGLAPGQYNYYCKFHPWMIGELQISTQGPSGGDISIMDSGHFTNRQFFAGAATWGFISRVTEVKQGTPVVFTNDGFIPHTVTSGFEGTPGEGSDFNSGFADNPASFIYPALTFTVDTSTLAVGSHPYFCDIHPWMHGVILVT